MISWKSITSLFRPKTSPIIVHETTIEKLLQSVTSIYRHHTYQYNIIYDRNQKIHGMVIPNQLMLAYCTNNKQFPPIIIAQHTPNNPLTDLITNGDDIQYNTQARHETKQQYLDYFAPILTTVPKHTLHTNTSAALQRIIGKSQSHHSIVTDMRTMIDQKIHVITDITAPNPTPIDILPHTQCPNIYCSYIERKNQEEHQDYYVLHTTYTRSLWIHDRNTNKWSPTIIEPIK